MKKFALILTLLLGTLSVHSITPRSDINPALIYWKAFAVLPDLSPPDRDYLLKTDWTGKRLDDRSLSLLRQYDNTYRELRNAVLSNSDCDWGLDLSQGPQALLPYLSRARSTAQIACLRAQSALQSGAESDAIDELVAEFFLARNLSRDGTILSALVQTSIENTLISFVAENFYQFSNAALQKLESGIEATPARGTLRNSLETEQQAFAGWFIDKLQAIRAANPLNESQVLAEIKKLYNEVSPSEGEQDADFANRWIASAGGTSEGVLTSLKAIQPYYTEMDQILQLPYAQYLPAIQAFDQKVARDPNLIVAKILPAISKAKNKEWVIQVKLAMFQAAIAYRLNGQDALKNALDPATGDAFDFQTFQLNALNRGFSLSSHIAPRGFNEIMIFVENAGPAFYVEGPNAGKPILSEK